MTQDHEKAIKPAGETSSMGFADFMKFPFDMTALLDIQRRNFEAASQAQVQVFEGFQAAAMHQAKLATQAAADVSEALQSLTKGFPSAGLSAENAEPMLKNLEKSMKSWQEMSNIVMTSNTAAMATINDRLAAALAEFASATSHDATDRKPRKKAA